MLQFIVDLDLITLHHHQWGTALRRVKSCHLYLKRTLKNLQLALFGL
uniref:Uncharacterized protein n=1 Tax=Lotus japonicus TaxID=34305 RepID=I3SGC5_LOTJA|nr:unknown [Lotus japonicus]